MGQTSAITYNGLRVAAVGDFGALHCLPAQKFDRSTQLQFCTSPPIEATRCYHQCFLVCRGLSVYLLLFFSLSFCRAVGHFLKFLFLLFWLCKLFDKALVCGWSCVALAMCLQNGFIFTYIPIIKQIYTIFNRNRWPET